MAEPSTDVTPATKQPFRGNSLQLLAGIMIGAGAAFACLDLFLSQIAGVQTARALRIPFLAGLLLGLVPFVVLVTGMVLGLVQTANPVGPAGNRGSRRSVRLVGLGTLTGIGSLGFASFVLWALDAPFPGLPHPEDILLLGHICEEVTFAGLFAYISYMFIQGARPLPPSAAS